jgi:predicted Fe-Mo cluster-binding NifX family protein
MKVAVTSIGQGLTSQVDPRFGRAAGFVVLDTESGEAEFVENSQNVNAAQGAGIQAARTVVDRGVECVITGHCGPNAFKALSAAGVKVALGATGTVAEAVEALSSGALVPSETPDVQGHWV